MFDVSFIPLVTPGLPTFPLSRAFRRRPVSIFVVDDDPVFCRHLERLAKRLQMQLTCYHPDDFARLPLDGVYDAAVIDYSLGELTGVQLSALYRETPVLLISGSYEPEQSRDLWPASVRGFVPKLRGPTKILRAALALGEAAAAA